MIDPKVVSPSHIAAALTELWSPRVVGEVDDVYVKVAKVHGTLAWHSHANEDELFFVLKGHLRIEMENQSVELDEGEMFVVPKGVLHNPVAAQECHVLLIERKSTQHTALIPPLPTARPASGYQSFTLVIAKRGSRKATSMSHLRDGQQVVGIHNCHPTT